jgi:hypothetical protein
MGDIDLIKIFIGWDKAETVAYHVLAHSIIRRSSQPVEIIPLNRKNLAGIFTRPRGEIDSTDFSNSRFIVPHLCDFEGWAIFMDCDMVCLADINELWAQRDERYAVMVKHHEHVPHETKKFLGQEQTKYMRKNWSSLMMFNNARCRELTKHTVNTAPGLFMHQFRWVPDSHIGEINGLWNHLIGYDSYDPDAKLIHYTSGGPWHRVYDGYSQVWFDEYDNMIHGDNPVVWDEKTSEVKPASA